MYEVNIKQVNKIENSLYSLFNFGDGADIQAVFRGRNFIFINQRKVHKNDLPHICSAF